MASVRRRGSGDGFEDWEAEGLDPEGPSPEDLDRFGGELKACPRCGDEVYDQAEICPRCGHAFGDRPSPTPQIVVVIGLVVVAVFVLVWVL